MTWRNILRQPLVLTFLLLPFLIPYSISFIPGLVRIYDVVTLWKLVSVLLIFALFALRGRASVTMLLIVGFNAVIFASSWMNGLRSLNYFTDLLPAIAIPMLAEMAIHVDRDTYLRTLYRILLCFISINFVGVITFPEGLPFATLYTQTRNPLHFLGQDNGIVYNILPALGVNYLLRSNAPHAMKVRVHLGRQEWNFDPWLVLVNVIALLTMVIVGSATGLVLVVLFITLTTFSSFRRSNVSIPISLTAYGAFMFSVVISGGTFYLLGQVTDALGRDAGFTGRSVLWERALSLISERPILGYGNNPEVIQIWGDYFSAHNQLLDVTIRGGVVALIFFIAAHMRGLGALRRCASAASNIIFVTLFCFLLGGLMEAGVRPMQLVFLVMAAQIHLFNPQTLAELSQKGAS